MQMRTYVRTANLITVSPILRLDSHPRPLMPRLSDLQASLLLEEIACAMRIGAPLDESLRRLESRRLGAVGRTAGSIADGVAKGLSVSDALRKVDPTGQAAAAVEACEKGGDPSLLDQIAFQLRRRAYVGSESRLAWFYPLVLLAVGYLVAIFVFAPLVRRNTIENSVEGVQWPGWVVLTAQWLERGWWIPPIIAVTVLVAIVILLWRRAKYSTPTRLSLFCSALSEQILRDVPESEAVRLAAEFSGERSLKSLNDPTLRSPSVVAAVEGVGDWQQIVQRGDKLSIVAALRYRASCYDEQSRWRDYLWMRVLPQVVMVLVGAGLTLSYVWWVIAPVYLQVAKW